MCILVKKLKWKIVFFMNGYSNLENPYYNHLTALEVYWRGVVYGPET